MSLDYLTARGRQRLVRYIEDLIDVAAQGKAGFADWHAEDVATIVLEGRRKQLPRAVDSTHTSNTEAR